MTDLRASSPSRVKPLSEGAWRAAATSAVAGVVAALAWLLYLVNVGSGTSKALTVIVAVAVAGTAVCAAFAAASLVLRTLAAAEQHGS